MIPAICCSCSPGMMLYHLEKLGSMRAAVARQVPDVRLTTTRGTNEGSATTSSQSAPNSTTKSYTRAQMQVSATALTKKAIETGICMLRLHLVSDHWHQPGGTMFSSAAAVTWEHSCW